jgi:hypothetical protein
LQHFAIVIVLGAGFIDVLDKELTLLLDFGLKVGDLSLVYRFLLLQEFLFLLEVGYLLEGDALLLLRASPLALELCLEANDFCLGLLILVLQIADLLLV